MVVEVSPCDTATIFGLCFLIPASSSSSGKTEPHSTSMGMTSAPKRLAISTLRCPKRPKIGTSTRSPGSMSEASAASMPARAVPSMSSVQRLRVWKTPR